jgi:hypothetical protein
MRPIDLEARVISAVDRIRAGQSVEDDLIECKRDWPQESKARQLAGSLNRAGGDPVVYIIGIDEKTGAVHDISGTDVLDWWGQIIPKFDQLPPEMVRHLFVPVGGDGEHVVAVAFDSARAPFLVKTGSANPSLEVPMREGTGTRTARRDELLRLLIPSIRLPEAIALEGYFNANYYPKVDKSPAVGQGVVSGPTYHQKEALTCSGKFRVFFSHNGQGTVTLPTHGMRGTLWVGDASYDMQVGPAVAEKQPGPSAAPVATRDAITITTSGAITLGVAHKSMPPAKRGELRAAKSLRLELELEVLGATRNLGISVILNKEKNLEVKSEYQETIGKWGFRREGLS